MRAWLVTWEWTSPSAEVVDHVAAILPPRWTSERVSTVVELLYAQATSTLSELAAYAKNVKANPYRAKVDSSGRVHCGHHPFLLAAPVKDLTVTVDDLTGCERISWHTMPVFGHSDAGPVQISPGRPAAFQRTIKGPLSSELTWDRATGRRKPQFVARDA